MTEAQGWILLALLSSYISHITPYPNSRHYATITFIICGIISVDAFYNIFFN